jgi:hypothetical protein
MDISLKLAVNGSDQPILDGVCAITQWKSSSGITKEDWVIAKISEWVRRLAVSGTMRQATITQQQTLVAATTAAQSTIIAAIGAIPIRKGVVVVEQLEPLIPE